jgi:hypothetical protein
VINKNKNDNNNINSKDSVTSICSQYKISGENNILYLLMIHFSAQRQYLGLLVHEKMICEWWTGKWKETVVAQQLHDSSNSLKGLRTITKVQFRILLALTNFCLGTSRIQATNITDDQTWLIYMRISSSRSTADVIILCPLSQRRYSNTPQHQNIKIHLYVVLLSELASIRWLVNK